MKKLILATALLVGTVAISAQTTPQKRDTTRPDTTRTHRDMKDSTMNKTNSGNSWDKSKTDTANSKNRDAVQSDRKMKKKNK